MATSSAPLVECEQIHAGVTVSDIPAAVEFYTTKLGFALGFTWGDPPTFAGVNLDQVQMFLQKGTPEPKGSAVYFLVGDADMLYEFHRANGVDVAAEIGDREYGIRDYVVRDLHGYYLTFGHHLFNTGPSIAIDRVTVLVDGADVGKSVTGFAVTHLLDKAGHVAGGRILFKGQDITHAGAADLRALHGAVMAMISGGFSSSNPQSRTACAASVA